MTETHRCTHTNMSMHTTPPPHLHPLHTHTHICRASVGSLKGQSPVEWSSQRARLRSVNIRFEGFLYCYLVPLQSPAYQPSSVISHHLPSIFNHHLLSPAYPPSSVISHYLPSWVTTCHHQHIHLHQLSISTYHHYLINHLLPSPAYQPSSVISHHLPSLLNHHLPSSAYPPSSVIINHHLPSLFNQSPPTITVQSITTCHHQYTITSHNHRFKTAGTPPCTPRMHTFKSQRHKAFQRQFQGLVLLPAPAQPFRAPRQSACFCTLAVNTQPHVSIAVARQGLFPCKWPGANCFHSNYSPYCLRTTGRRNSRSLHLLSTQMCNPVVVSSSCRHTLSRPAQTTKSHSELPCPVSTHPVPSPHPALSPHTLCCLHTPALSPYTLPHLPHPTLSPYTLSRLHTPCPVST